MRKYSQPTYLMDFYFLIGKSRESAAQSIVRKFGLEAAPADGNRGECFKITVGDSILAIIVWTEMKKNQKGWAATIGHECLHAANMTLHDRGVVPSYENDEPQTYLMSELITEAEKAK